MTDRLLSVTALLGVLVLSPNLARAGDAAAPSAAPALFGQGAEHFTAGRYAEAAKFFEAALALEDRPSTRFNLAATYERVGDRANASLHYRAYLKTAEDAGDRRVVEAIVRRLEAEIEAAKPVPAEAPAPAAMSAAPVAPVAPTAPTAPAALIVVEPPSPAASLTPPPPVESPPPPPVSLERRMPAYAAFGVAAIAAGAAIALGAAAGRQWRSVEADHAAADIPSERSRLSGAADRARSLAVTADLIGVAALLTTGAGVWFWLDPPGGSSPTSTAWSPTIGVTRRF